MSRSLLAGRAGALAALAALGRARGIVLTSRSVASLSCERMDVEVGAGDKEDWSSAEESQDVWTALEVCAWAGAGGDEGVLACGFAGGVRLARAWASHASRVLSSTGQAAAGSSWEDIVIKLWR